MNLLLVNSIEPPIFLPLMRTLSSVFHQLHGTLFLVTALLLTSLVSNSHAQFLDQTIDSKIPAKLDTSYLRGIRYLIRSQDDDGAWSSQDSTYGGNPGVVGLALMAIMAHGDNPNSGPYAQTIQRAVQFIIDDQDESTGMIGDRMYDHGFATTALAEAYGMVDNEKIGPALQKAVDLLVSSQSKNRRGGWRYDPGTTDTADTSIVGCCLVALFAARNAGIEVPDESIEKGLNYLSTVRTPEGGYGYTSATSPSPTRTAIGHLSYSLAREREAEGYDKGLEYLKKNLTFRDRNYAFYFEYYMSQALFHADEKVWEEWNAANITYLTTIQLADGSWASEKGSTFSTAGALLSLALNYRFLPIYER